MTTPPPPISPTVATPLAHRKRRHSEINGSERPKVAKPGNPSREHAEAPEKSRLQVPQPRGRSATPVKRDRSATPSTSAKKPVVNSNGTLAPQAPGSVRMSAPPRPSVTSRPSASPRPTTTVRPSVSPRPSATARPGASPRPPAGHPSPSPRPKQSVQRRIEDSDSDDNSDVDKSDIEDILDAAELEPFTHGTENDDSKFLDRETAASLRRRLLKIGPQEFMQETLSKAQMPPQTLGTVFGLDPDLLNQVGEEIFLRILGQMVVRQYFKRQKLPQYNTLDDVAELLKKSSNIVIVAGAGISTSLGIPDFRSKHTGFYAHAQERAASIGHYISEPEEIFDLERFDESPELFYKLAGDILPNEKRFSPTHAFIKLLQDKGKLLTCYSQNIDNLEESAGITKDKLIQCHGSFATATCRRNGVKNPSHRVQGTEIFDDIRAGRVAECKVCKSNIASQRAEKKAQAQRKKPRSRFQLSATKRTPDPGADDDEDSDDDIAPGIMKPDITFFGEQLPNTFFERFTEKDCKVVDLVLVLGTSLKVAPVSEMPNYLPHEVPHVYVSREAIRHVEFDVQCLGDCDDVVVELCGRAGWTGPDEQGVIEHKMVTAKNEEGVLVVKAEEEEEGKEACKWRVRREALF